MQQVDFTTLQAIVREIESSWMPSRVENVYQKDPHTIALSLRTLQHRGWLTVSWHPEAARIVLGSPPPKIPDTFTFSQQLRHQLGSLALTDIARMAPWERILDLRFARRPGEEPLYHLYIEIMGKYSNVILTDANNYIITTAHQVNAQQSSVRTIQTGQPYELPPKLTDAVPSLTEPLSPWRERIELIPEALNKRMVKSYRGLSTALVNDMIKMAGLVPTQTVNTLSDRDWENLFKYWQIWLQTLEKHPEYPFSGGLTSSGYSVLGWGIVKGFQGINELIDGYYQDVLNKQEFQRIRHQLQQKLKNILAKLEVKANTFRSKLAESDLADRHRDHADLLMANLHQWKVGMTKIEVPDFHTGEPVTIPLEPERNIIQNAQLLYKKHQKLKRAQIAVIPLLQEVEGEIKYLEQVSESIEQLADYREPEDLRTIAEIREELINENYLHIPEQRTKLAEQEINPHRFQSPSGFELLIGRNNRQNDRLSCRLANDYDLWFHTQEIAGSHGLLRIPPGKVAQSADLQFAANLIARYSKGKNSDAVPVVYTEPKHVYKPKGAKPGMVIYKHERIIWGYPHQSLIPAIEDR